MLARLPIFVILTIVIGAVLFKVFTWALSSPFVTKQIRKVTNPRTDSADQIAENLNAAREARDSRIQANQEQIDASVNEQNELRRL